MKILILSLTLLLGYKVQASDNYRMANPTPDAEKAVNSYIETTIRQSISLPESMKATTGQQRILIVFTVLIDGSVVVNEVGTDNKQAKNSLTHQFQSLNFAGLTDKSPKTYSIRLNFNVLY
jgi:hypothetical protein